MAEHEHDFRLRFNALSKGKEVAALRAQLEQARDLLRAVRPHLECFKTGDPAPRCFDGAGSEAPCSTCLIAEEVQRALSAAPHPETEKEPQT